MARKGHNPLKFQPAANQMMKAEEPRPIILAQLYNGEMKIASDYPKLLKKYLMPAVKEMARLEELQKEEEAKELEGIQDASPLDAQIVKTGKDILQGMAQIDAILKSQGGSVAKAAKALGLNVYKKQDKAHQKMYWGGLDKMTSIPVKRIIGKDAKINDIFRKRVKESQKLITSLKPKGQKRLNKIVNQAINGKKTDLRKEIAPLIREESLRTWETIDNRAQLIAVDQMHSYTADLQQARNAQAGITHYFWRKTNDGRVRPQDVKQDGKRYSYKEAPPGGHPGQKIRCRCTGEPDLKTVAWMADPKLKEEDKKPKPIKKKKKTKAQPKKEERARKEVNRIKQDKWEGSVSKDEKQSLKHWGSATEQSNNHFDAQIIQEAGYDLSKVNFDGEEEYYLNKYRKQYKNKNGTIEDWFKQQSKESRDLEKAIATAPPHEGTIFRGLGHMSSSDVERQFVKGAEVNTKNVTSWSRDDKTPLAYASFGQQDQDVKIRVVLEMEAGDGTASVSKFSGNPGEKEVLVSRDKNLRVSEVIKEDVFDDSPELAVKWTKNQIKKRKKDLKNMVEGKREEGLSEEEINKDFFVESGNRIIGKLEKNLVEDEAKAASPDRELKYVRYSVKVKEVEPKKTEADFQKEFDKVQREIKEIEEELSRVRRGVVDKKTKKELTTAKARLAKKKAELAAAKAKLLKKKKKKPVPKLKVTPKPKVVKPKVIPESSQQFAARKGEWVERLAPEEQESLVDWSVRSYDPIRRAQTSGFDVKKQNKLYPESWNQMSQAQMDKWKQEAQLLEKVIIAAPEYKGSIFRGINVDPAIASSSFKQGSTIKQKSISSWSKSRDIAEEFAAGEAGTAGLESEIEGNTEVLMILRKPQSGVYDISDSNPISESQEEVAMKRAKSLKIIKTSKRNKRLVIEVEEVEESIAPSGDLKKRLQFLKRTEVRLEKELKWVTSIGARSKIRKVKGELRRTRERIEQVKSQLEVK